MLTFAVGDRVKYAGRTSYPSDPERDALGTVTWSGNIMRIDQPPLRDWVRVRWDNPTCPLHETTDVEYRADQVRKA